MLSVSHLTVPICSLTHQEVFDFIPTPALVSAPLAFPTQLYLFPSSTLQPHSLTNPRRACFSRPVQSQQNTDLKLWFCLYLSCQSEFGLRGPTVHD